MRINFRNIKGIRCCPSLREYRLVQILGQLRNNVWKDGAMSSFVGGVILAESVALYVLFNSFAKIIPRVVILIFLIVAMDMFIVILTLFKVLARPLATSCALLRTVKNVKMSKYMRTFVRSCPPSKLRNGNGKYLDKMSSLIVWQTCVDLLITLLLNCLAD